MGQREEKGKCGEGVLPSNSRHGGGFSIKQPARRCQHVVASLTQSRSIVMTLVGTAGARRERLRPRRRQ
eukprot:12903788-Prorocentrum_lima.AAC.1